MGHRSGGSPVKRRTGNRAWLTRSLVTVVALDVYAATLFAQSTVDLGALDAYFAAAGSFRADYGYQNIMFIAAGEIIPATTGRSWDEFIRMEFFEPLGMRNSVSSVAQLDGKTNVATPHGEREGKVVAFPWYGWDNMSPAGGIIDLTGDLTHWHYDTFEVEWRHQFPWFGKGTVQFIMSAMGDVIEMKIDVPNEDFWFTELEFKKKE